MRYVQLYIWLLMLVFCTSCEGQKQTAPPKDVINYNIKDTVTSYGPHTMVRNVKKGKNGTILIAASWGGVFRYDGKVFTNITSKIGSRRYWDVLEDKRGKLWFATTYTGVYEYDGKSFKHFTTASGLPSNKVSCIYEDKAGIIWFGTGNGISRYDGKTFQNLATNAGPDSDITIITQDKTGKLWIGTRGNALVYDGKEITTLTNNGKTFRNVWGLTEDRKGNIWLGADGLWHYNGTTFVKVSQREAGAIIEDKKGNIWTTGGINASTWAFSRYEQKSLYSREPAMTEIMTRGPALFGLLEANDGIIWIGASDGVYRYDGKNITAFKDRTVKK